MVYLHYVTSIFTDNYNQIQPIATYYTYSGYLGGVLKLIKVDFYVNFLYFI